METTYALLFYSKKEKGYKSGPVTIYGRITVNGIPSEFSTGQKCDPEKWEGGQLTGRTEDIRSLKKYLETLSIKVRDCHRILLETSDNVSSEMLKNKVIGKNQNPNKLIQIFNAHNEDLKELVKKKEIAPGTLIKYATTLSHTKEFLTWKYNLTEIDVRRVDHEFVTQFEFFLKTVKNCSHNTSVKYIKNFGKIIRICLDNNWMKINPFSRYKSKMRKVIPVPLDESEMIKLIGKEFRTPRLEQIRDTFVFSCFTGLAYSDVRKLSKSDFFTGIDGKVWLCINRKKTDVESKLPLLPIAAGIVKKYADHPYCVKYDKALPVISNQKMNEYLFEIAAICEIQKKITTHTARHTFATTITLANRVPLETVSKMLGHTDVKMTQHYAQVLPNKVSIDMNDLEQKSLLAHLTPQLAAVS